MVISLINVLFIYIKLLKFFYFIRVWFLYYIGFYKRLEDEVSIGKDWN